MLDSRYINEILGIDEKIKVLDAYVNLPRELLTPDMNILAKQLCGDDSKLEEVKNYVIECNKTDIKI